MANVVVISVAPVTDLGRLGSCGHVIDVSCFRWNRYAATEIFEPDLTIRYSVDPQRLTVARTIAGDPQTYTSCPDHSPAAGCDVADQSVPPGPPEVVRDHRGDTVNHPCHSCRAASALPS